MHIYKQFEKRSALEQIDMFGIDISIRFCKQILHKTTIGGIFTILVLGLVLLQIGLIIQQFIDKTNPLVIYQRGFTQQSERYNLTKELFTLTVGVLDSKSVAFVDNSIYTLKIQFRVQKRVFNNTKNAFDLISNDRFLNIERCTKNHFQNVQTKDYYLTQTYEDLWCIGLNENNVYIEGQYDSIDYARLQIMVDMCQNSTTSTQICKPQSQIESKLNNFRLSLKYDDYSVVPKDKDNPFQAIGKVTFWISGTTFYKNTNIAFKNSYLYTDVGLLMKDIEKTVILSYSSDKEQTTARTSSRLYDCFIQAERNQYEEYYRSYMKIDKALSQIGGIYNILFTIGCLLCKPISQVSLNRKLLSSLFSIVNSDQDADDNDNQSKSPDKKEKKEDVLKQDDSHTQNQEIPSFTNDKSKKSTINFNNISSMIGENNNQCDGARQLFNYQNQQDKKVIQLKKVNSELVNPKNKAIKACGQEISNLKNSKNSFFTHNKSGLDEIKQDVSKMNIANSNFKSPTLMKSEEQISPKMAEKLQKSSIFNFFR